MGRIGQRRAWARTASAAVLAVALGGCFSTPRGPTSPASAASVPSSGLVIAEVSQRYIVAEDFQRISEFLTGTENKSGRTIERTHPDQRAGFYFILDLDWQPGAVVPKGTKATLEYVRNDKPDSLTANFVFSDEAGTWPEIFLGLTGPDWPDKNLHIVAYKITLTGPDGTLLASRQSFLWALPETKVADDATTTASPAATDGNK